jgi:cell fate (sporulation/competence/biofilm development) regulator YlbF (YheA/YmcA/DUF963 family)
MLTNNATLQTETETSEQEVSTAVHAFARALVESDEFRAFEHAAQRLSQDVTAQNAIRAFQEKQQALQTMLMLNAVSPEDQRELERLQQAFLGHPTVVDYLRTEENLKSLCQTTADLLSKRIGLSYTAACGPGCC